MPYLLLWGTTVRGVSYPISSSGQNVNSWYSPTSWAKEELHIAVRLEFVPHGGRGDSLKGGSSSATGSTVSPLPALPWPSSGSSLAEPLATSSLSCVPFSTTTASESPVLDASVGGSFRFRLSTGAPFDLHLDADVLSLLIFSTAASADFLKFGRGGGFSEKYGWSGQQNKGGLRFRGERFNINKTLTFPLISCCSR